MRIQYDEKHNIEFKESWRDEYLKWLCGFANAQGGTLYIGVNDKADVVGIENARKLLKVVIWNDATLPDGWTVEKFLEKHGSRPYNPEIANAFFRAGEIESWGRGIEKICAALREQNLNPPEYEQLGEAVCTTFHFVEPTTSESTIPAGSVKNIPNDEESSSKTAQKVPKKLPKDFPKELPKQAEATFIAIKNNPYATNDELAYILGISSRAVRNHIAVLKKVGFIRRGGSRTKGYWEIVE